MMRPKLVAAVLAGGIVVLGAGSAVAASLPSWTTHHSGTAAAAPSTSGPPAASASPSTSGPPAVSASPSPSVSVSPGSAPSAAGSSARSVKPRHARSITYTVKRGDTLSGIAEWFKLHGYGALYAANQAVIGSNPNLIIPGERITIAHGVMKLSRAR